MYARFVTLAFGIAALFTLIACGGSPSPTDFVEAATQAGGGFDDIEFDEDGGTISASIDGAQVSLGSGAGRPDWLEPEFVLPEGLDVQLSINDPSTGERAIEGLVEGGDAAAIMAQQDAVLTGLGYERIGTSGFFVAPGRMPIEISVEETAAAVWFSFEHSFEDEQTLRDIYAPVDGAGTLVASIGDQTLSFTGNCELRSNSGYFESDDALANLSLEIRDGEQDYILASVLDTEGDDYRQWSMLQVDDDGNFPGTSVTPDGMRVEGFMVNIVDGFDDATPVVLEVSCGG